MLRYNALTLQSRRHLSINKKKPRLSDRGLTFPAEWIYHLPVKTILYLGNRFRVTKHTMFSMTNSWWEIEEEDSSQLSLMCLILFSSYHLILSEAFSKLEFESWTIWICLNSAWAHKLEIKDEKTPTFYYQTAWMVECCECCWVLLIKLSGGSQKIQTLSHFSWCQR